MTTERAVEKLAFNLDVVGCNDPQQIAADLIDWYNVAKPDMDDVERLEELYKDGRFESWQCVTCDSRVYKGEPEDWGDFQGVRQVDYTSYPGGHPKQCDYCRCHRWQDGVAIKREEEEDL